MGYQHPSIYKQKWSQPGNRVVIDKIKGDRIQKSFCFLSRFEIILSPHVLRTIRGRFTLWEYNTTWESRIGSQFLGSLHSASSVQHDHANTSSHAEMLFVHLYLLIRLRSESRQKRSSPSHKPRAVIFQPTRQLVCLILPCGPILLQRLPSFVFYS